MKIFYIVSSYAGFFIQFLLCVYLLPDLYAKTMAFSSKTISCRLESSRNFVKTSVAWRYSMATKPSFSSSHFYQKCIVQLSYQLISFCYLSGFYWISLASNSRIFTTRLVHAGNGGVLVFRSEMKREELRGPKNDVKMMINGCLS
jgi:hypothetical protein